MNGRRLHQATPAPRRVLPWPDPAPGRCGHRPGSPDADTTVLAVRVAKPGSTVDTVDTVDRAASLGLGEGPDATAALPRTVRRLVRRHRQAPGVAGEALAGEARRGRQTTRPPCRHVGKPAADRDRVGAGVGATEGGPARNLPTGLGGPVEDTHR